MLPKDVKPSLELAPRPHKVLVAGADDQRLDLLAQDRRRYDRARIRALVVGCLCQPAELRKARAIGERSMP